MNLIFPEASLTTKIPKGFSPEDVTSESPWLRKRRKNRVTVCLTNKHFTNDIRRSLSSMDAKEIFHKIYEGLTADELNFLQCAVVLSPKSSVFTRRILQNLVPDDFKTARGKCIHNSTMKNYQIPEG